MVAKALALLLALSCCLAACAATTEHRTNAEVGLSAGHLVTSPVDEDVDGAGMITQQSAARRLLQPKPDPALCAQCKIVPVLPVCGSDGKTYNNSCYAALCAGVLVTSIGKCKSSGGGGTTPQCNCAGVWAPVCGGGKSWVNACAAKCGGVSKTTPGVCAADRQCPSTKATVCGMDGRTYSNTCAAAAAGTLAYYSGTCDARVGACKCATVYDPVCVTNKLTIKTPAGTTTASFNFTFGSPCLAKCMANATKWTRGACRGQSGADYFSKLTCGCPLTLKPVCAQDRASNVTSTQFSTCVANCAKAKVLYQGICKNERICLTTEEPVCANGKTYASPCHARWAKATTWKKGACKP